LQRALAVVERGRHEVFRTFGRGRLLPDSDPEELAAKDDLCEGAEPFVHYHFFDADGRFGSLDEEQDQVDDRAPTRP
jgi:hypothetical protein